MPLGATFFAGGAIDPKLPGSRTPIEDEQTSFRGGLNTVSAEDALGPTQFRRGDNGRLTPYGAFVKRGGTQRTNSSAFSANTVQNGYTWFQEGGTAVPMAICNGVLRTTTYGTFPLTWTLRAGALSTSVTPSLVQFISGGATDAVYIADGGLLNRYAGTTLTVNIAGTAQVKALAVHNERLWGVGVSGAPNALYYSALNDGDTLGIAASAGGVILVRTFGDQELIGLCSIGTSLLIFHRSGLSRLTGYGQSDITVSPAGITGDVGTIGAQSIVRVDNVAYFVSERGLYIATEQGVAPVATPEQPDILVPILEDMSYANIANVRAVLNRATRELLIYIPGYGVYLYHTILKAWCGPWTDGYLSPEVSCFFEASNANGYPIVLAGDASGYVRECDRPDVYLDNVLADGTGGTTFASALQPHRFYAGVPHVAKSWRFGYVLCSLGGSTTSTVSWITDTASATASLPMSSVSVWGAASSTWGDASSVWGASGQTSYRVQLDGNGYYIDVTLSDSGEAAPVYSQVRVEGFALGRR